MLGKVRLIYKTALANKVTVFALCMSEAPYFDAHIVYYTKGNELLYIVK